jgi:hypothetical protein
MGKVDLFVRRNRILHFPAKIDEMILFDFLVSKLIIV